MKTALVALNSKYIHTNPAVRCIKSYALKKGAGDISIIELSINDSEKAILKGIYSLNADIYIFSSYIWNIGLVKIIADNLRKINHNCIIISAGPQTSYNSTEFLEENPAFDIVIRGEGEKVFVNLVNTLETGGDLSRVRGVTYRQNSVIKATEAEDYIDLDELPFIYEDLDTLPNKILYYESTRGCPFSCSYCLSSAERGIRARSLGLVFDDLLIFIKKRVKQVKFVDRTFNFDKKRALLIWKFLSRNDNGFTNFHFEIAGDILDKDTIKYLSAVRPGLFQFEIGVQSTNAETLAEIDRTADEHKLFSNITMLLKPRNISIHLDLIAGLPYEDLSSFKRSFNEVYLLSANMLQLGFLKVLNGSKIERNAQKYGLFYTKKAPFEVLCTRWLSFEDLTLLYGIEEMLDKYHNSGRFTKIVRYLEAYFETPFDFYKKLHNFYISLGYSAKKPSKTDYYDILFKFAQDNSIAFGYKAKWLIKFDMLSAEKLKKAPRWLDVDSTREYFPVLLKLLRREEIIDLYLPNYRNIETKHLMKIIHAEIFPFSPDTLAEEKTLVIFNYDLGQIHFIPLQD